MIKLLNFAQYGDKINEDKENPDYKNPTKDLDITSWESMTPDQLSSAASKRMTRSKMLVINLLPFFGALAKRLSFEENWNLKYESMATDGFNLYYDPRFVMKHTGEEIRWVIVHEILHCALRHFQRRKANADVWNAAADYALNQLIPTSDVVDDRCKMSMPKGALGSEGDTMCTKDQIEKFKGRSAEAIYDFLLQAGIQPPKESGWNFGNVEPPDDIPDPVSNKNKGGNGGGSSKGDEDIAKVGDYIKIKGAGYGQIISIDGNTGEAEVKLLTKDDIKKEVEAETRKQILKIIG